MSEALVSILPPETLVFALEKGTPAKVVLRVTNTSSGKVLFKVKTTQPLWFFVRPNQQVIDVGQTEDVIIALVDSECKLLLERALTDKANNLDSHRFLVQTKMIETEDYEKIMSLAIPQRIDEYTRLWDSGPKDEKKKSLKLRVDFTYPKLQQSSPNHGVESKSDIKNDGRSPSSKGSKGDKELKSIIKGKNGDGSYEEGNSETLMADLVNLRSKYNAVIEYTVNLTAERDSIVHLLEETDKELARETSRRKLNPSDQTKLKKSDRLGEKKMASKGFSLISVFILATICYLAGRYFRLQE